MVWLGFLLLLAVSLGGMNIEVLRIVVEQSPHPVISLSSMVQVEGLGVVEAIFMVALMLDELDYQQVEFMIYLIFKLIQ